MKRIIPLYTIFSLLFSSGTALSTALDDYVATPDPNYTYSLANTISGTGYTAYVLEMTSQQWRDASEVDRPIWQHWLIIIIPDTAMSAFHTAFLWIDGGSNGGDPPNTIDEDVITMATTARTVVASLEMVPNEPLTFTDETESRTEDEIIAYTFDKYLNDTTDETWPLLLPMVKSAVRAMDTVQDYVPTVAPELQVDDFVVSGGSKRGWTTWLTAAADDRVRAIFPAVINMPNFDEQVNHHYSAYGFYSSAVQDYVDLNVLDRFSTPEGQDLLAIVDPYEYRDRYANLPKYEICSTGDQFFLPDSHQFYFSDIPGEKYVRFVPNTDHGIDDDSVVLGAAAYYISLLHSWPRPSFSWTLPDRNTIRVESATHPLQVKLWQANNPTARDFRLDTIGPAWTSTVLEDQGEDVYVGHVPTPEEGWTAFFLELVYLLSPPFNFYFTTEVRVVPDLYPGETPTPTHTPTETPTPTPTPTPTFTSTPTATATPTGTSTMTPTATPTPRWSDAGWATSAGPSDHAGYVLYGAETGGMAGIASPTEGRLEHLLCHFQVNDLWFTGLVVSNIDSHQEAEVAIKAYDRDGLILSQADLLIPPHGKVSRMVSDPSFLNLSSAQGWIHVDGNTETVACLVYKHRQGQGMAALTSGLPSDELVFPHFHRSETWWTGLALVNPGEGDITVRITAFSNEGITVDMTVLDIPGHGQLLRLLDDLLELGTTESGWLLVEVDLGEVSGLAVYGTRQVTPNRIAALSQGVPTTHSYVSDFRSGAGWWTGLSLVNPAPMDGNATVILSACSSSGMPLEQEVVLLGGLQKVSDFVSHLFDLGFYQSGWVDIESDYPIVALQTLNAGPPDPTASGLAGMIAQNAGTVLHFPHYDVGSVWWTLFALLNPGDSLLELRLQAYDSEGSLAGSQLLQLPQNISLRGDAETLLR